MYSDINKVKQKTAKLTKRACAFKGYANSYTANILDSFNPELQIKDTESAIKSELIDLLIQFKVFKFMTILLLELKKIWSDDKTKYDKFYSHSKAETVTNEGGIDDVFESML